MLLGLPLLSVDGSTEQLLSLHSLAYNGGYLGSDHLMA